MNIFVIPSWYPSQTKPLRGIFVKEQIESLAKIHPEINLGVSLWGHDDTYVGPTTLFAAIRNRLKNGVPGKLTNLVDSNVFHLTSLTLHWSHRLPLGGHQSLLKANRKNFLKFKQLVGHVDVIHAHVSYPAGAIAQRLAVEFNLPYVVTEHMGPFPFPALIKNNRLIEPLESALQGASQVIAVSDFLAREVNKYMLRMPIVIPNLVDEEKFDVKGTQRNLKFTFFTLASLVQGKGIDLLVEAIAKFDPSPDLITFRIGGEGPLLKKLQAQAEKLGVNRCITWLESLNRKAAVEEFSQCDVFVLPSRFESFGVVYAEALASGKPVIATRCGGPESIVNSLNGILVDVDDVDALCEALKDMYFNYMRYDPQAIRSDFLMRFSRPAVVEQIVSLYKRVVTN